MYAHRDRYPPMNGLQTFLNEKTTEFNFEKSCHRRSFTLLPNLVGVAAPYLSDEVVPVNVAQ
jgi:hypothetical protein